MMEYIAYDKAKKVWVDPGTFFMDGNGTLYEQTLGWGLECVMSANITGYPYIGRKDKNGKKIYEGSLYENAGDTYEVYFNDARLEYMGRNIKDSYDTKLLIHTGHYNFIGHIAETNTA